VIHTHCKVPSTCASMIPSRAQCSLLYNPLSTSPSPQKNYLDGDLSSYFLHILTSISFFSKKKKHNIIKSPNPNPTEQHVGLYRPRHALCSAHTPARTPQRAKASFRKWSRGARPLGNLPRDTILATEEQQGNRRLKVRPIVKAE
jgi:hypothetical protein